ncbi:low molecular weight phosphotyrosine protein phosphatase [Gordonia sp. zg691]|uniref:Low molecular weight phosphotyrosine protein phosphatase n=1 Tax=Gordonia jinghuaiqii TaxID=2758710 RepID=A0A7D7LV23_9ACTN|nr:low molecular weight protein-tyrosine-phosphatase [Gordonia jinghuaiqii]MBD0861909.1 low molecular weight phosphotyrosine protein phosphatase [Gordonia jinghuaiqii]MCR5977814.1 low molecular weight phosphotyrosine protein phosphatase [Gordonia jinghuaiqii]QMT03740.1 low molecular weight phosphotyrosine protein phosphatase [Gordonia jinghuaiqii]
MSILFVCTGNICRSPIGERVLDALATRAGVPVSSTSAGVGALNGAPIHPHSAAVLTENGYNAEGFEARYLRPPMLGDADLVLCMSREHRAAVQQMAPVRWKRVFTLTEFAALTDIGSLTEIIAGRGRIDPNSGLLDIVDPMGRPREDFDRVFAEIEPKVETVTGWLAGQVHASGPAGERSTGESR